MNNFFATPEGAWGDGSVHVTPIGITILVIVIAALIIGAAIWRQRNSSKKKVLTTKQLVYSAAAIGLAVVCSMIKLFEMPMGGSVTLLSMLFIVLIAYWYGPYVGIMTAVAYGLVQFVTEPIFYTLPQMLLDYPLAFGALGLAGFFHNKKYGIMTAVAYGLVQFVTEPIFYTLPQMLLDYPLAFGALGLAGFFHNKKYGLQIGYIAGVLGRFLFSTASGVIFFASYAPEGMHPLVYSSGYQASYLVPEAVVTLIIISIPPVAKALAQVKRQAVEN